MQEWMASMKARFFLNLVKDNRWKYLADGLVVTLKVTFFAVLLGILIGMVVASIRATRDKTKETMRPGIGKAVLAFLDWICRAYLTVIRGTPVVVQLMISYYLIFASSNNKVLIAILSFGINSGAYVAEIIRGGLMSLDTGQSEAGRSLGLNYIDTMRFIVIPQAFKAILPSLGNEFIGGKELLHAAQGIYGRTYEQMYPLLGIALMYLALVMLFSWLQGILERRLRQSDRR